MQLHILGANGPFPASGGACSGYLVTEGETHLVMDLGSGTLGALTALTAPEALTAILISHWHFDHTSDLLPLAYRLLAAGVTLPLYAPADEHSAIRRLVGQLSCYELHKLQPGDELTLGALHVQVFEARHPVPAVMLRLAGETASLCYTGDTNTLPNLAEAARGCDALLADALFTADGWREDAPHLSAALAARMAQEAGVKRLILTHQHPAADPHTILREAKALRPEAVIARRGDRFEL